MENEYKYFTYILHSTKINRYYVGSSKDVERRLYRHNNGHGTWSRRGIPWVCVYKRGFNSRSEAYLHEMEIKKRGTVRFLDSLN